VIDELVELLSAVEDKGKMAICDLLKVTMLKDDPSEYLVTKHWNLIE